MSSSFQARWAPRSTFILEPSDSSGLDPPDPPSNHVGIRSLLASHRANGNSVLHDGPNHAFADLVSTQLFPQIGSARCLYPTLSLFAGITARVIHSKGNHFRKKVPMMSDRAGGQVARVWDR